MRGLMEIPPVVRGVLDQLRERLSWASQQLAFQINIRTSCKDSGEIVGISARDHILS